MRQRYINKQIGHVPCDVEQRNAIVILMQFVPSCIVCLDEINPVAHPIMGGKLEVLHKIKNYLQLIKLCFGIFLSAEKTCPCLSSCEAR